MGVGVVPGVEPRGSCLLVLVAWSEYMMPCMQHTQAAVSRDCILLVDPVHRPCCHRVHRA